jgi:glycosyltransferase involved in cell wall biosynthesis
MSTLLSINNYYYYRGGAETVFLEHNNLFQASGWQVVPFAMRRPQNLDSAWSQYFIDDIELGEDYSLREKLIRLPKVIYSLEARAKLGRLIDATAPDIAHAHNIYHHISPSILSLLKQRRIPTVLTLHDLKIACPAYNMLAPDGICERCRRGRIYNVLLHRCIKGSTSLSAVALVEAALHRALRTYQSCVSRFVVPSQFYLEKLCAWGWPRSAFSHVPNFVDAARYRPQYAPGRVFLYFGRLAREKGLATLIRAAAQTHSRLLLIGTGPDLDALRALATQLSADVEFPGYLSGESLHAAIRGARAIVLPSEWYENAPMSVLEAYALGKPVLGARIGGIPELIQHGETGLQFDSGNVDSLADALRTMTDRPDASVEDIGRRARLHVEKEFSAAKYQERIATIYRELGVAAPLARSGQAIA